MLGRFQAHERGMGFQSFYLDLCCLAVLLAILTHAKIDIQTHEKMLGEMPELTSWRQYCPIYEGTLIKHLL